MRQHIAIWAASAFLALPTASPAAIDIQEIVTPGGIQAWLVEDHSIPFAALEIRFPGGASIEPDDKLGAAYLMTGLFNEGAGEFDAISFQERQEELAANFGFDAYKETISVSAQFLTENRDESVDLLRLALAEPRFDQEPLDRVRNQVMVIIQDIEKDPGEIASEKLNQLQFGDHPYARRLEGTIETVSALTAEDLRWIHRNTLVRDSVVVGAVGDISPDELAELLDRLLGELPASGPDPVAEPEYQLEGGVTVIDFPSPQSVVQFAHAGLLRNDPDFLTAYVLNEIFGGSGFSAILNDEVRIKRGLTYSVRSLLASYRNAGIMVGELSTANDRVVEAVDVVRDEWRRVAENGVTEQQLADIKTYLTGAYPLRFDGNSAIAGILAGMQFDDIPASYVRERNDLVRALTLEEVNDMAASLLQPDALHFVVVGQPDGLD